MLLGSDAEWSLDILYQQQSLVCPTTDLQIITPRAATKEVRTEHGKAGFVDLSYRKGERKGR